MMVDNPTTVMAVLFALAAIGFWSETTKLGSYLTGTVVVILLAIIAANVGFIPHQSEAYDFVFSKIVPVIIPLFLFKANIVQMMREASRLTLAFLLASFATVLGVLIATELVDVTSMLSGRLDANEARAGVAGLFTATYIGGSVNYAALGEITTLVEEASFFSAATAVDNVYSALYLTILALLPAWHWLARKFIPLADNPAIESGLKPLEVEAKPISAATIAYALALSLSIVAVSDAIVAATGVGMYRYAIITLITVGLATFLPSMTKHLSGSFELGIALSMVFFGSIAAGANVSAVISIAPMLIVFAGILLTVHAVVLLVMGRWLKLSLPELIIASNAAILGATTAPAMAAAKGWHTLVTPSVLVGVLGYALGTLLGTAVYQWLL
ncbi:MAG: DUF819 family protein [Proteobacteria bacterium]|nr:DUF819 family protein [Pseudomonadota bacterium]